MPVCLLLQSNLLLLNVQSASSAAAAVPASPSGHVLISPKRVVKRFAELTSDEVADMWGLAQLVGKTLEPHYKASSLTLAIQVWLSDCLVAGGLCVYLVARVTCRAWWEGGGRNPGATSQGIITHTTSSHLSVRVCM
jgi:hypothetical protein